MRKKWINPQLIILVRNQPAEFILNGCKLDSSSSGPTDDDSACRLFVNPCTVDCNSTYES